MEPRREPIDPSPELVVTRDEARAVDARAIEEYGIPSIVLMENAGRACAAEARRLRDGDGPVLVLAGPGNNGGDGFVIARTLDNVGLDVELVFVGDEARLERCSEDVRTNARLWRGLGRELELVRYSATDGDAAAALGRVVPSERIARASLVVDALFGTGMRGALRAPFDALVRLVGSASRPVLAVDLPSGLDADTGEVAAGEGGERIAVRADVTVTFVARKRGFDLAEGPSLCGRVVVAEIGIPRAYLDELRAR